MPGGGPHPKDEELFALDQLAALAAAAEDLRRLRANGYALNATLKLVGDHYGLRERQRTALQRATSEAAGAVARAARHVGPGSAAPRALWLDGFNLVITLETALHGGVLVTTVDGGLRDLAGVHGSYRTSDATARAVALAAGALAARGWERAPVRWLLDAPVSNSGRLATALRAEATARALDWTVEVVPDPDVVLSAAPLGVVVGTGDAVVLDRCAAWVDLASEAVRAGVPEAWIVDLDLAPDPAAAALPIELDTARLRLRPPRLEDARWVYRDYAQDPEVARYLTWRPHERRLETEAFLAACVMAWAGVDARPWVIERRADGQGLGMIEARRRGHACELGYVLARAHWGQGLMTEAVDAVASALLAAPSCARVCAVADVENPGSARVLEKAGFQREGRLLRYIVHPNVSDAPRDVFSFARVR